MVVEKAKVARAIAATTFPARDFSSDRCGGAPPALAFLLRVTNGVILASLARHQRKSVGLQGVFSYVAFSPSRNIGVFVAINEFSVSGFEAMAKAANELITELAPR